MKKTLKNALIFTLIMLPFAAVGGYLSIIYQLDSLLDEQTTALLIEQYGSLNIIYAISVVQTVVYSAVCAFLGYLLADKLGLIKPWKPNAKTLAIAVCSGLAVGVFIDLADMGFFALDAKTSGVMSSVGAEAADGGNSMLIALLGGMVAGGVYEELMMRFFLMSLIAFILWKLFARKNETAPVWALVTANVLAALLFAAGHLPANNVLFGQLTALVVIRCMTLNSVGGLLFGRLYRKYGILYAMICHAFAHVGMKGLLWVMGMIG